MQLDVYKRQVFGLTRDDKILEKGFKYFKGKYYFVRKTEILNER